MDKSSNHKDSSIAGENFDEFDCNVSPDAQHSRHILVSRQTKSVVSLVPSINSTPVLLDNFKHHSKYLISYL